MSIAICRSPEMEWQPGNVYVTNDQNERIVKFSPSGQVVARWA